jgi:hypothetical protein
MEPEHMTEKQIEQRLCSKVKALGGLAIKLTTMSGLPDRLVLLPGSVTVFIELKAPGRKLTAQQLKRKGQLEKLGFSVYRVDSYEKIDEVLDAYKKRFT